MNVVGAFVGVHAFQVHHMADDVVFIGNAVAAVHVAGDTGNVYRLAAIIAFDQRNHLGAGEASDQGHGRARQQDVGRRGPGLR